MKKIILLLTVMFFAIASFSQYQNIEISNSFGPNEPSICMDPKNPNRLIVGANTDKYFISEDGGLNWGRLEFSLSSCKMAYITGFDKNNLTLWPYNGAKCVYRTNNGGGPYSGVNEKPDVENSIRIFPNPANNTLTISLNRETIKHAKAFIINLQGQTLLQSELVGKENSLDISNLPAGVYFVKVVDENGVWIEKVVKE